jgi:hypothetical protein
LLFNLEHLISFNKGILFQFLILLLMLELLEHAFLLSFHLCLFLHLLVVLHAVITGSLLQSLGFDLREHVVVPGVVEYYSLGKAFMSLSLNEGLEEGIGHGSSLRSGAREISSSIGLSVTVAAGLLSRGNER